MESDGKVLFVACVQTGGFFSGFTRLSKGLAAVLVTGYLANAVFPDTVSDTFALIPGK